MPLIDLKTSKIIHFCHMVSNMVRLKECLSPDKNFPGLYLKSSLSIFQVISIHLPTKKCHYTSRKRGRFRFRFDISPKKNKNKFVRVGLHKTILKPRNIQEIFLEASVHKELFTSKISTSNTQIILSSALLYSSVVLFAK